MTMKARIGNHVNAGITNSLKMLLACGLLLFLIGYIADEATAVEEAYVDVYYNHTYGTTDYNSFNAETNNYVFQYGLQWGSAQAMTIKNSGYPSANILKSAGTNSLTPAIKVNGVWYSSVYAANHENKMIIKKAGKNLWEILIKDIELKSASGGTLPLRVDQTFYFWNEKFYVVTAFKPSGTISDIEYAEMQTFLDEAMFNKYNVGSGDVNIPASGTWTTGTVYDHVTVFDNNATLSHGALSYQVINKGHTESLIMQSGNYSPSIDGRLAIVQRVYDKDKHSAANATWYNGQTWYMYTQLFVSGDNSSTAGINDTAVEMDPLSATEFQVTNSLPYAGSRSLGYDNTMGAYVLEVYTPMLNFYKREPNLYPSAKFAFTNDAKARQIRLKTAQSVTHPSGEAPGVTGGTSFLTDENMVPNGIPVQTSKKWDNSVAPFTSYVNSFSSFNLAASTSKTMWHRTSPQKWGNKVNVGLPSLDLSNYNDWGALWIETSIGQSEVMCYLPDDPANATMADFRAIGGVRLGSDSSPWFHNAGGNEFLKLFNGTNWIIAKRKGPGIRFTGRGPNLSEYTMVLQTQSGQPNVKATVTSTLLPSVNGSRVFYKIHYDFLSDYTFTDIKKELSLFSASDIRYAVPKENSFAYKNSGGTVSTMSVSHNDTWNVSGASLHGSHPWVAFYNNYYDTTQTNNAGFVVHSFSGRFNSAAMNNLAVSMYAYSSNSQTALLVPDTAVNTVKAGDYADLVVEAYTWNPSSGNYSPIENEASKWPTTVTATYGTKLADFPARVQVGASQYADFTVTGGVDFLPVTAEGFTSYAKPQLEEYISGAWQVVNQTVGINDAWQTDLDETNGTYKVTYAVPADGGTHRYKISMVASTVPTFPASIPTPTWTAGGINLALSKTYSASSVWDATNYDAAKAFDGSTTTRWSAANGASSDQWLQVNFGGPKLFSKVIIKEANDAAQITSYKLQISNNDVTWVDIWGTQGTTLGATPKTIDFYPVTAERLRLFAYTTSGYPTIQEMEAYNSANLALGKTFAASSQWDANHAPGKAFDEDFGTRWTAASGQSNNQWLSVDFGTSTTYQNVMFSEATTAATITSYKLQYSSDNTNWTDIPDTAGTSMGSKSVDFSPITSRYLRLYVNTTSGVPTLWEMEVYNYNYR